MEKSTAKKLYNSIVELTIEKESLEEKISNYHYFYNYSDEELEIKKRIKELQKQIDVLMIRLEDFISKI
tara:strand:+ start:8430 stop:8636 length:207 start_codon:yes stop_codon:yes gene_type:complete